MTPAIILFTTAGAATASRIAAITGGRVHSCGSAGEGVAELLPRLFAEGTPIVGVCSAGILIRLLAAHLGDKHAEPPVLAVSGDGRHVVPLLGGHHGGNQLADALAEGLGGVAAITTASNAKFKRGLDEPPMGYRLAEPEKAKTVMAALLNGEEFRLLGQADWLTAAGYEFDPEAPRAIAVTARTDLRAELAFYPQTLVAGVGCERGTPAAEIIELVGKTLEEAHLAPQSLACLASIDIKADEEGLLAAAQHFGVPLRVFSAPELAQEEPRLTQPSEIVRAETGTPGVAEAAALKAGELVAPKKKTRRVTCAIGEAAQPIAPQKLGRSPGILHVVGIGPGDPSFRTKDATVALQKATDWVGYSLYLDLIADLSAGQTRHDFGLGDEEKRVRHALELAATGKTVALVGSGDAQIYAMAALVHELLDAQGPRALSDAARRVAVISHPGITALQMASARAGALIGHDFCAISLSDLLTPRADIVQRIQAAATGDFVTAFYNPRSNRRTDLLDLAVETFKGHRPPHTPVVVARALGRAEEKVFTTTLAAFDPSTIDMMTIVLFGARNSKSFARSSGRTSVFTPRGYAAKEAAQ